MKDRFGHLLRILYWRMDQSMTAEMERMELTAAQGHVVGYLAHQAQPPCPRDIESQFHLSHATVNGLLSRLEQKGFLEINPDPEDRRCKRITLLPKGQDCHESIVTTIKENEQQMLQGFSPEEQQQFSGFLLRAIENMGGSPCHSKHKEETVK